MLFSAVFTFIGFLSFVQSQTLLAGSSSGEAGYQDGMGENARFNEVRGMAVGIDHNIYVVDSSNHRIRKITPEGVVTTIAGSTIGFEDGEGSNAEFNNPWGIAVDSLGNMFVTDFFKVRKITPSGVVSTVAGTYPGYLDGIGTNAKFYFTSGIATDSQNNLILVDDEVLRKITPLGVVSTLAGSREKNPAVSVTINAIDVNSAGNIFVTNGDKIQKITPQGVNSTFAKLESSRLWDIKISASNILYVISYGLIYSVSTEGVFSNITTDPADLVQSIAIDRSRGILYYSTENNKIKRLQLHSASFSTVSAGVIAGSVIAALVIVGGIIGGIFYYRQRNRASNAIQPDKS